MRIADMLLVRQDVLRSLGAGYDLGLGRLFLRIACVALAVLNAVSIHAQTADVQTIIKNSVEANKRDFAAAPDYNHEERDRTGDGTKLYRVTMIDGSPYQRLLAVNGKPLSGAREGQEKKEQQDAASQRSAETASERRERVEKYQRGRTRDNNMMEQLTKAFNFRLLGDDTLRGFNVFVLEAIPRPGYKPPNMDAEVLPGMRGKLWIDKRSFQWVKVTAQVIHPVSIGGFLAEVEPGTRFELEKAPVAEGIWQPSHFAMHSHAKVLFLWNRSSSEDDTFSAYTRAAAEK